MKYLYEITVRGRVQGVGFRYFVLNKALELHLTGFVRNAPDRSVQIEAEGDKDDLEVFLDYLRNGTSLARVDELRVSRSISAGVYQNFIIRY